MSEKLTQLSFVDGIQLITSRQGFHKRMNFIQKESLQFELILKEVRKIRKTQLKYETLEVFKGFHKFFLENNIKMGSSGSLNL